MSELAELGRIAKSMPSHLRQQAKLPFSQRSRAAKDASERISMARSGQSAAKAFARGKDARAGREIGRGLRSKDAYQRRIADQYADRDRYREWKSQYRGLMGSDIESSVYGPHLRGSRTLAELGNSMSGERKRSSVAKSLRTKALRTEMGDPLYWRRLKQSKENLKQAQRFDPAKLEDGPDMELAGRINRASDAVDAASKKARVRTSGAAGALAAGSLGGGVYASRTPQRRARRFERAVAATGTGM